MGLLVPAKNQNAVKTMDFTWSRCSEKSNTVLSVRKAMYTVSWDSQDVMYIDKLEERKRSQGHKRVLRRIISSLDAKLQKWPHLNKHALTSSKRTCSSLSPLPRPSWSICDSNCCQMHCIRQTFSCRTFCFQI